MESDTIVIRATSGAKAGLWTCLVIAIAVVLVSGWLMLNSTSAQGTESVQQLEVLNCIFERQNAVFEHVIYFTLQDDADNFKFFVNAELIGNGSFDDLDIRYSPPYRRVVFMTSDRPKLPLRLQVEAFSKDKLVGTGVLVMTKSCYHDME